jgi:hypothetical protein
MAIRRSIDHFASTAAATAVAARVSIQQGIQRASFEIYLFQATDGRR